MKKMDGSLIYISGYYIQIKNLRKYYKDKLLIVNANFNVVQVKQEIESKISCDLSTFT